MCKQHAQEILLLAVHLLLQAFATWVAFLSGEHSVALLDQDIAQTHNGIA